ncbi:UvrD-helicase domain-containing protein [Clostridium estertheticum]|uniref:UvrD-helicase domain-containing protein n=1 Tax=Clostridium estertheticum TaxID=238834 RepID=UPI001C0DACBF|nr:UvrD-helicase domain-containing protein [Clostridium estertheticum]MBU3200986.1 UvrD-helicase domain-containing protein [Clostridium estertheticum]WAG63408.1 UvrD-helicase domain-containing protein [Clostridium estertheticum]
MSNNILLVILGLIVAMLFISSSKKRRIRIQEQRECFNKIVNEFKIACEELNGYTKDFYYTYFIKEKWKYKYKELYSKVDKKWKYEKLKLDKDILNSIDEFKNKYSNIEKIRDDYNKKFIRIEKINYKNLFDNIEGRALDQQQRECVIKEEINNLVIAGAGTGKTTTIVGKVKYLLEKYNYNSDEILVLSFTNASASEMAERVKKETGKNMDVMTFHKLGKEIIAEVEGKQPSITQIKLINLIEEEFAALTKNNESYNGLLNKFFLSYMKEYRSRFDFKNEGEFIDYLKDNQIQTFKNEVVKSYEEMEIANFLFINRINYEYEKNYKINTADRKYSRYRPDFYLTDYEIYIEHFGIDRKGNVPKYFTGKNGVSAKEVYNDGIRWKREIHKKYNTKLIETYSYEKMEGNLLEKLEKQLKATGVVFNAMSRNEVWKVIEKNKAYELKSIIKLINTFIMLMKSNGFSVEAIKQVNVKEFSGYEKSRNDIFINITAPIYEAYNKELISNDEIDFSDMINKATKYILEGKFNKKYSYIIVDEYQDISLARYSLIKAIKELNNSKLFCVGDDWQSIYRFAGGDVNLFVKFDQYFGFTEKTYIETTYRFNKSLIDLSGKFVLKNKEQIKKKLKSFDDNQDLSYELLYGDKKSELTILLKERLNSIPPKSTVALLGRYKDDLKFLLDDNFSYRYDSHLGKGIISYKKRFDLHIEFLTVHKSKGLQADYVFIVNNSNGKHGFPSKIEDDKVLNLLIQNKEKYEYAEERRLFYVALTRAKKHVYLLVENNSKSSFIREIEEDNNIKVAKVKAINCPECKKGELKIRTGPYGEFYACSNYPLCEHTEKIKVNNLEGQILPKEIVGNVHKDKEKSLVIAGKK